LLLKTFIISNNFLILFYLFNVIYEIVLKINALQIFNF
jgi:hypothetical protein